MTSAATQTGSEPWRERLRRLGFASPLYRLRLLGRTPDAIERALPAPLPGDPARGARLAAGTMLAHGTPIALPPRSWFEVAGRSAVAELHGFGWLGDLVAAGGNALAATLIRSWIAASASWHPVAWSPEVLGRRVAAWLQHAHLLAEDPALTRAMLASVARQLRHLVRVAEAAPHGLGRLDALAGLALGWAAGLAPRRAGVVCRRMAAIEPGHQLLSDGMHVTRSPSVQLAALARLVVIRDALAVMVQSGPALDLAIAAMAGTLQHLRMGDGTLALFNGSAEEDPALIDSILTRAVGGIPASADGRVGGFERVVAGEVTLLIDADAPPAPPFDDDSNAGTLSFELSFGRQRLIGNCGGLPIVDDAWRLAQRATAAHSTAVIADTNSAEIIPGGGLGRRPVAVVADRQTADGATLIAAAHDGYSGPFGIIHRRRLYVARDGSDIRGEDTFDGRHDGAFALRFHLHPEVKAARAPGGQGAVLQLPSGLTFQLDVAGAAIDIESSVYLGRQPMRRSLQVIAYGRPVGGTTVKWALRPIPAA